MIKVCDAIMGSGKSSAAITYINSHPEKKFLYLTPYLDEAARIKDGCPDAHFVEPRDDIPQCGFSKSQHLIELVEQGENIASTHQAMLYYTPDTIQMLRDQGYCIIIDESVDILQCDPGLTFDDVHIALEAGLIYESAPGEFMRTDKPYNGKMYTHMLRMISSRPLIQLNSKDKKMWYWVFSKELFKVVDDVYVLTYLFKGSEMEQFLVMNNIPFRYIGVSRSSDGIYSFSDRPDYIPEYVAHLKDLIHIEEHRKLNAVGDKRTALSMNWYGNSRNAEKIDQLRKNIYNYYRNIIKNVSADGRMCGTFDKYWNKIRSGGYGSYEKNRVIFCQRSTNKWAEYTSLVYPVNVFINPNIVNYYTDRGGHVDGDVYALSIMIQWIWRSAIRNGKEIYIYIPSKRMRDLLIGWIDKTSKGVSAIEQ